MHNSYMVKNWASSHEELSLPPKFRFNLIISFPDAFTRQVSETVGIYMRGGEVLNIRSEYSRCRLTRLVIDQEGWKKSKKEEQKLLEGGTVNNDVEGLETAKDECEEWSASM